jgi:hypothetical protein
MPLDHYVPQVHLKNFNSSERKEHMYATRKSDMVSFPCHSASVCRIENGNTNSYLTNDRVVEDFLLGIEPKYNSAVIKLRNNTIDKECIYVIADFVAYVNSCAPAAMRIQVSPLQNALVLTTNALDRKGVLTKSPPLLDSKLGSKSMSELLTDGTIHFNIDPKYPQALGIESINSGISIFGNSRWEILQNDIDDNPFFTSDYPIVIEKMPDGDVVNRIVPLTPDLAIRIIPDINLSRTAPDLSFSKFKYKKRKLGRAEIVNINRMIVRCAEDLVFYCRKPEWITKFIEKNRHYRIETIVDGTGLLHTSNLRIVPYRQTT